MAVLLAATAASLFAVAAIAQNAVVNDVAASVPAAPVMGAEHMRALIGSRAWILSVLLTAIASVLHAAALVLAPVALVQPIGVLAVPLAVLLGVRRFPTRPGPTAWIAIVVCISAVAAFVVLADAQLRSSAAAPSYIDVLTTATGTAVLALLLTLWGSTRTTWRRCASFAASGATAFGLVSALTRLVAVNLSHDRAVSDPAVWSPAVGLVIALLFGTWAVQQAHAAGSPTVVLGVLTVVDPIVAVFLGATMLGEGDATDPDVITALAVLAATALAAATTLAQRHPAADHRPVVEPS